MSSDMILAIFPAVGFTLSVANAYKMLQGLIPADPYRAQKAAGSLGGASRHGTIALCSTGHWVRLK